MHATIPWRSLLPLLVAAIVTSPFCLAFGKEGDRLRHDSREVYRAIDRGAAFLKSQIASTKPEHKGLLGLELLKYARYMLNDDAKDFEERVVSPMAADIQKTLGNRDPAKLDLDIESSAWAVIFLANLDGKKYGDDVDCLVKYLERRQKPHGGWGPPDKTHGDMAMTQLAVMSLWEARLAGRTVSIKSIEAATTWLLRTQDPNGGFGREGILGDNGKLTKQRDVGFYSTVSGLGTLYVCAHLLGMYEELWPHEGDKDETTPKVKSQDSRTPAGWPKVKSAIDVKSVHEAFRRGNQWMAANYKIDPKTWTCRDLYSLERYESFHEFAEVINERDPKWFGDGARLLLTKQNVDGSWQSSRGKIPDTAMALLFLVRSRKVAIRA